MFIEMFLFYKHSTPAGVELRYRNAYLQRCRTYGAKEHCVIIPYKDAAPLVL